MRKTFNFGKIDYYGNGRKINLVTVQMELRTTEKGEELSAYGMIWNNLKTDVVCGGQCLDEIKKYIKSPLFLEIYKFWKLYHLNGMHAGTRAQEKAIEDWESKGNKYDYTAVCEYLKSIDLYEVEHNGQPYKYGHGWIFEEIPENDLQIIKELLS